MDRSSASGGQGRFSSSTLGMSLRREIVMIPGRVYQIFNGPSDFDLMLALFDRSQFRTVKFQVHAGFSRTFRTTITEVSSERPDSWLLCGCIEEGGYDNLFLWAMYNSRKRIGAFTLANTPMVGSDTPELLSGLSAAFTG